MSLLSLQNWKEQLNDLAIVKYGAGDSGDIPELESFIEELLKINTDSLSGNYNFNVTVKYRSQKKPYTDDKTIYLFENKSNSSELIVKNFFKRIVHNVAFENPKMGEDYVESFKIVSSKDSLYPVYEITVIQPNMS